MCKFNTNHIQRLGLLEEDGTSFQRRENHAGRRAFSCHGLVREFIEMSAEPCVALTFALFSLNIRASHPCCLVINLMLALRNSSDQSKYLFLLRNTSRSKEAICLDQGKYLFCINDFPSHRRSKIQDSRWAQQE